MQESPQTFFYEKIAQECMFQRNGVVEVQTLQGSAALFSFNTWQEAYDCLSKTDLSIYQFVILPELITSADCDPATSLGMNIVKLRITEGISLSSGVPNATLVIGSAYQFDDGLYNAVLFVRNGQIVNTYKKRTWALDYERERFKLGDEEPVEKEGIGILVCSDFSNLSTAVLARQRPQARESMEINFKKGFLFDKANEFLDYDTKTLIIPSAWGIGLDRRLAPEDLDVNMYYRNALITSAIRAFKQYPNLAEIVVCDSVVIDYLEDKSTVPFNAHFKRKDFAEQI